MKSLALALLLLPGAAFAGPWYELVNGTMSLTGVLGVAASSTTPKNYVLLLNGRDGYIQFPDGTKQNTAATAGLNYYASTGTFTGTNTFSHTIVGSITGSAGSVPASGVDLSTVTTALAGKLTAPATFYIVKTSDYLVAPASFTYQAQGNYITSLTGGVTASGPGAAAATIVSVPQSAVNLSTVTTALASKANVSDVIPSTATGTYALSTTGRAALATSADNATTVTNGAYVNASNYFTGVNQFTLNTTISNKLYVDEIQLSSAVPSIIAYNGTAYKNTLIYPGIEINSSPGYAYNWILASTDSLKMKYYDAGPDVGQYFKYDKYGLVTSSGIRAGASRVDGSGGVNIIGSDGRIPALTSTYIANLDGTAITGVTDATKVAKAGDTMSGQLTVKGSSITIDSDLLDWNFVITGANKHSIKMDNRHALASTHNLAEIDFLQLGTIKHQISAYGDTNATYPQELQLGSPSGTASKVRITGSATLNPDIFVSSFTSVGINTAAPNAAYKLDVNGNVRASGFTGDGSQLTGITGTGAQALLNSTNTWTATQNLLNETNFNIGTGGGIGFQNYTGTDYGGITYQGGINYFFGGPAQLGAQIWNGKVGGPSVTVVDSGVGVNDTSPSYALDVTGGGHFTSSMTVDGGYYDNGRKVQDSTYTWTATQNFQTITSTSMCIGSSCKTGWDSPGYILASSASVTNVASITFSNLSSSRMYRLVINLTHLTASQMFLRFNGATAGYSNSGFGMDNNSGTGAYGAGMGSYIVLHYPANTAINYPTQASVDFSYSAGNVWATYNGVHYTGSLVQNAIGSGTLTTTPISSLTLATTSGNITGTAYLFVTQ